MAQRVLFGAFGLSSGTTPLPWPTNTPGPTVTDDLLPMTTLGCGVFGCRQSSPSTGFRFSALPGDRKPSGKFKIIKFFNRLWKYARGRRRSLAKILLPLQDRASGEMAEWLKAHAWKACVRETVPWVRIPLSPPSYLCPSCNGEWVAEPVLSGTATAFATRVISSYGCHAPQQACRVRLFVERCDPRLSLHFDCRTRPPLVRQAAEDCLSGPRCDRRVRQAIVCYSSLFSLPQRCLAEFDPGLGRL